MSQGCPSVSHQLAAASIAFRRARKKFPKDYGVRSKDTKTEVEWTKKNKNDQPASSSSAKCMINNDKSQCFCSSSVYSDDGPRYLSAKQSLSIKQSKCTCCRHNKEYFEDSARWSNDQSAVGDVLDKVSTRERFIDVESRKSVDRYNHDLERDTKNNFTHLARRKCTCCPVSIKKRVENDSSKLDSVDLLYVASHEKHCCVNSMDNHGVIDHKDSISILMEKYKSRNAQDGPTQEGQKRKNRSKGNERIGNRYEKSPTSRILARENRKDSMEGLENSKSCDRCRCQENHLRWKEQEEREQEEKTLLFDDGRNRIRGEGDFYRRKKPARSKFGVPWRHTF
ncbi:hypothetical protein HZH66_007589 [Vespula vulgaris]|uniref:Uncharacterized protein n=1 Tax=Vespula vulgaris TaxID=7454 RepID=A0A834JYD8_VESVU|nr:hypothetical protein HZH66_007589 [Vespula vulgaris]